MHLRYITTRINQLGHLGFEEGFMYQFNDNIRFISNYLSKAVRKEKIELEGFNVIETYLTKTMLPEKYWFSECFKAVYVPLYFSDEEQSAYEKMKDRTVRYEYYLSLFEHGYRVANTLQDVQVDTLLRLHDRFREGGYRNEWLFKKKPLREWGIYVYFKCYFTSFEFRLELEVYNLKQTELLTKGIVWRTDPNELCYDKDFRHLVFEGNRMIVTDFLDHPHFGFDLERLRQGDFHVEYLQDVFTEDSPESEYDLRDSTQLKRYQEHIKNITW